jgi:hypothetical protein
MYQRNFGGISVNYTTIVAIVVAVVFLIGLVGIFSLGKAVVTVYPRVSNVATDFSAQVVTDGDGSGALSGVLFETDIETVGTSESTGTAVVQDTNVIGAVTLINNYSKDQTLVATTRLLSPDGVLLRMKEKATVPAGGKVVVKVYADNPAAFKEIPATMFTIPGLWKDLQDKIYGESKDIIKNKPGEMKIVKAVDIVKAKEMATKGADEKAIKQFSDNLPNSQNFVITVASHEPISESVSAKVGDNAGSVEARLKQKITLIAVEKSKVLVMANDKVDKNVSDDRDVISIDSDKLSYTVEKFDTKNKSADVKIHAEAKTVIKVTNSILDKTKLAGLTAKGAQLYLLNFDEIENAEVVLSPFWVKKIPDNVNKIFVQVK